MLFGEWMFVCGFLCASEVEGLKWTEHMYE
jgi:hypothetical protein